MDLEDLRVIITTLCNILGIVLSFMGVSDPVIL